MPRGRPKKTQDDVLLRSAEMIGWALGGLEREIAQTKARLTALTTQATSLRKRLGSRAAKAADALPASAAPTFDEPGPAAAGRKRRRMSPEARKRISEMMKKRWAERRKGK